MKQRIDPARVQQLLRQLVEIEDLRAPSIRTCRAPRRAAWSWIGVAAAAALVLALTPFWSRSGRPPADTTHATRAANHRTPSVPAGGEFEFAFVLFRDWTPDCRCEQWKALDLTGGSPFTHLYPAEQPDTPIHGFTGVPARDQPVILAVGRAPRNGNIGAQLARCLNERGMCDFGENADQAEVAALNECFTGTLAMVDTVPAQ